MASEAIILMDLTPLACTIISLGHLLIDRSLGGAMASVYGDREAIAGRRATACDGVRRRRLLRRLTRYEIASQYRSLTAEGAPGGRFFLEWVSFGHQMVFSLVFSLAATSDFCLTLISAAD